MEHGSDHRSTKCCFRHKQTYQSALSKQLLRSRHTVFKSKAHLSPALAATIAKSYSFISKILQPASKRLLTPSSTVYRPNNLTHRPLKSPHDGFLIPFNLHFPSKAKSLNPRFFNFKTITEHHYSLSLTEDGELVVVRTRIGKGGLGGDREGDEKGNMISFKDTINCQKYKI